MIRFRSARDSRARIQSHDSNAMKNWASISAWFCQPWILAVFFALAAGQSAARPVTFVPDAITGYAIGGHDPVSYFVDNQPRMGLPSLEYAWGGGIWVFVNQGNLAAFKKDPQVYAPMFAGCGGYALASGFAAAGNPNIFAKVDGRLMFFHSVVNRFLFLVNSDLYMGRAEDNAEMVGCSPAK